MFKLLSLQQANLIIRKELRVLQLVPMGFSSAKFHRDPIKQLRRKLSLAKKEEHIDNYADTFFSFLKKEEKSENRSEDTFYIYHDKIIYINKLNKTALRSGLHVNLFLSGFWGVLIYPVWFFLHPIATVIPAMFCIGSTFIYRMGKQFLRNICYQMEFMPDNQAVKLFFMYGKSKEIICPIKNFDIRDVVPVQSSYRALTRKDKQDYQSFIISIDAESQEKQSLKNIKLLVEPHMCEIENIDLFKFILNGEVHQVNKFKYHPENEEDGNEKENKKEEKNE